MSDEEIMKHISYLDEPTVKEYSEFADFLAFSAESPRKQVMSGKWLLLGVLISLAFAGSLAALVWYLWRVL